MYDNVHPGDILWEAWKWVKANGGSGGVDGITIDHIVKEYCEERFVGEIQDALKNGTIRNLRGGRKSRSRMARCVRSRIPVNRDRIVPMAAKMVLEPIFEADFKDCSYGFRPKRSAHDAIRHIRRAVKKGVYWVVDIDITEYFDNIPHEKLLQLVEQRISDRRMLKLSCKWLEAGFVKDDQFHESELGSPQGGVISPLLANIYLDYLDTIWEKNFMETGTLVRYADDLVVLFKTKEQAPRAIDVLKAVFAKLELEMNKAKSKLVNLWNDKQVFDFLGMHHPKIPKMIKGNKAVSSVSILRSYPSKKAMKNIKEVTELRNRLYWT